MPDAIIGGVLVKPRSTAPDARSCSATKESESATKCSKAGEPAAQVRPLYFILSLSVYGMPSRRPSEEPAARRASEAAASSKTLRLKMTTELRHGPFKSNVPMRWRYFVTSSMLVTKPDARAAERSDMLASTMLCTDQHFECELQVPTMAYKLRCLSLRRRRHRCGIGKSPYRLFDRLRTQIMTCHLRGRT